MDSIYFYYLFNLSVFLFPSKPGFDSSFFHENDLFLQIHNFTPNKSARSWRQQNKKIKDSTVWTTPMMELGLPNKSADNVKSEKPNRPDTNSLTCNYHLKKKKKKNAGKESDNRLTYSCNCRNLLQKTRDEQKSHDLLLC